MNISSSISEFVRNDIEKQKENVRPKELKFEYIWLNLDKIFRKLPEDAVDELNVKYINMAYEKLQKTRESDAK